SGTAVYVQHPTRAMSAGTGTSTRAEDRIHFILLTSQSTGILDPVPATPFTEMPDWLEPMAATLTQDRFTGPDWVFERKFDGIRLLAYKCGSDVRLYSRNRLPQDLPAVAAAVARLPVDEAVLDGEMTWDGRSAYLV